MNRKFRTTAVVIGWVLLAPQFVHAAAGTTGADFLNIPVGAEPVSLGGAYSAFASNAYAPTWNPGGLGFVDSSQLAAQHLAYIESIHYEYFSFAHPFQPGHALGGSVQYIGSGNIPSTDESGNSIGTFSSHYAAYSLAYGQALTQRWSLGIAGKVIDANLGGVSARATAVDVGSLFQATEKLTLAAVLANAGNKLTFINQQDPLPLVVRFGGAYKANSYVTIALEGMLPHAGDPSLHSGIEWRPNKALALRAGYRTDTTKGLSALAGLTMGVGVTVFGQTVSYAYAPLDELGTTQTLSLLIRFKNSP